MKACLAAWQAISDGHGRGGDAEKTLSSILGRIHFKLGATLVPKSPGTYEFVGTIANLSDALWMQLAQAVLQSQRIRKCRWEGCPNSFVVSPLHIGHGRHGRDDKQFCSDSCRVKAYLRRRETAAKLRADGVKLRDIAKQVNTDLDTLKKWLGEGT
jgi:hypothetical protein